MRLAAGKEKGEKYWNRSPCMVLEWGVTTSLKGLGVWAPKEKHCKRYQLYSGAVSDQNPCSLATQSSVGGKKKNNN